MGERTEYQPTNPTTQHHAPIDENARYQAPELITKKWLCIRFNLIYTNPVRCNYKGLYKFVLTGEVLQALGDPESIRQQSFKMFTRQQTVILCRLLDLK